MHLIVGLGNPGEEYKGTYHNVGFDVVEDLAKRLKTELKRNSSLKARIAKVNIGEKDSVLMMPMTFMNRSGEAVKRIMEEYGLDMDDIIVVHDEFDLEIGTLKVKKGGGSAGHYGLQSVIDSLGGRDFVRIRIGIGKPGSKETGAKYVLSKLNKKFSSALKSAVEDASSAAEDIVRHGTSFAMNKYNRTAPSKN